MLSDRRSGSRTSARGTWTPQRLLGPAMIAEPSPRSTPMASRTNYDRTKKLQQDCRKTLHDSKVKLLTAPMDPTLSTFTRPSSSLPAACQWTQPFHALVLSSGSACHSNWNPGDFSSSPSLAHSPCLLSLFRRFHGEQQLPTAKICERHCTIPKLVATVASPSASLQPRPILAEFSPR
jgi:hypothetical protein